MISFDNIETRREATCDVLIQASGDCEYRVSGCQPRPLRDGQVVVIREGRLQLRRNGLFVSLSGEDFRHFRVSGPGFIHAIRAGSGNGDCERRGPGNSDRLGDGNGNAVTRGGGIPRRAGKGRGSEIALPLESRPGVDGELAFYA